MADDAFSQFLIHRYGLMSDEEFDALTPEDHKRLIEQWTHDFHADNHRVFEEMTRGLINPKPSSPRRK